MALRTNSSRTPRATMAFSTISLRSLENPSVAAGLAAEWGNLVRNCDFDILRHRFGHKCLSRSSMRHQGRKGHGAENPSRNAAENELPQARMAVAAHDQEIRGDVRGMR